VTTVPAESIIEVDNLTIGYVRDGQDTVLLEDVSFNVLRGEVFAILGGSGSGKSTLLKHMIGLLQPLRGRITIEGDDIVTADGPARRAIMRKFGVMYQMGALFGSMSTLENVRLPLEEFTQFDDHAVDLIARTKLYLVGLSDAVHRAPAELSGGMQKRAAIARAMALDPAIMFLDEPSAGLDPITSAELDRLIIRLARALAITFVVVTHELPSIFAIADRVILLDSRMHGVIATGTPTQLRDHSDNPWVHRFFNREPEETLP
jgi:phospholipid/cholesterol/gamma-HCH transport system ATP-binding protein